MKSAINRRIWYSRGELNNYMENYKNLSNYMKKIKEHESIKKNECMFNTKYLLLQNFKFCSF